MVKFYITGILCLCIYGLTFAQHTFKATIKDSNTKEPLLGVSVYIPQLEKGAATDRNGFISLSEIPDGEYTINIQYIGYQTLKLQKSFPLPEQQQPLIIYLTHPVKKWMKLYLLPQEVPGLSKIFLPVSNLLQGKNSPKKGI